jgi:hypothetical protein
MASPPHPDYRDEDEGPIILSLISQLRCAPPRHSPNPSDADTHPLINPTSLALVAKRTPQSRHGPLKGHLSDLRPRAQEYARTHNRLYGPSGSHIWVGCCPLVFPRWLRRVASSCATNPTTHAAARFCHSGPNLMCFNLLVSSPRARAPPLLKDCLYNFSSYSQRRIVRRT